MIRVRGKGDFRNTRNFLNKAKQGPDATDLNRWGEMGVRALSQATPEETGLAANSWGYRIVRGRHIRIEWFNKDIEGGVPVVILIQYGHATGTGGYVRGRDFINPAMRPQFAQIESEFRKKVRP